MTDRDLVVAHLHWNGKYASDLTDKQWLKAYRACDGFGGDYKGDFDWSHVRDSSEETFKKVAEMIRKWRNQ